MVLWSSQAGVNVLLPRLRQEEVPGVAIADKTFSFNPLVSGSNDRRLYRFTGDPSPVFCQVLRGL